MIYHMPDSDGIKMRNVSPVKSFPNNICSLSKLNGNMPVQNSNDMNQFTEVVFNLAQNIDVLNKSIDEITEIIKVIDTMVDGSKLYYSDNPYKR